MFPIRDHNPSTRTPVVTYALVAANILVFLWQLQFMDSDRNLMRFWEGLALVPAEIMHGLNLQTLITSQFLHAGFGHIFGNMLFLWIFGDNLEDQMGHFGFLVFYLACGLAAAAAQILPDPYSLVPMVGASGAIAGVMGGYLLLFPRARVDVLIILVVIFRVIPVPAWLMLGIWFALQVFGSLGDMGAGGVAYWAHAGGFAAGTVLTLHIWTRRGGARFWQRTAGHPPHPGSVYRPTTIPIVRRRKRW